MRTKILLIPFCVFTLIICLGKSSGATRSDFFSEYSPLLNCQWHFSHQIACINFVYSHSFAARMSTAQLYCVWRINSICFQPAIYIFPFDDPLRTRNSERHWIISSHIYPLQFYWTVLCTSPVVSLPAWACQPLTILRSFPDLSALSWASPSHTRNPKIILR